MIKNAYKNYKKPSISLTKLRMEVLTDLSKQKKINGSLSRAGGF